MGSHPSATSAAKAVFSGAPEASNLDIAYRVKNGFKCFAFINGTGGGVWQVKLFAYVSTGSSRAIFS